MHHGFLVPQAYLCSTSLSFHFHGCMASFPGLGTLSLKWELTFLSEDLQVMSFQEIQCNRFHVQVRTQLELEISISFRKFICSPPIAILFQISSAMSSVSIYSALWKPYGREFQRIGSYADNFLKLWDDVFPNVKYGLNGRKFFITINFVCMKNIILCRFLSQIVS